MKTTKVGRRTEYQLSGGVCWQFVHDVTSLRSLCVRTEMEITEELRQQLFGTEGSTSQLPRVRRPTRVVALTDDLTQSALQDLPGELELLEGGGAGEGQPSSGMAKEWLLDQLRQAQVDQNREGAGQVDEERVGALLRKWLKTERVNLWTHVPENREW